MTRRYRDPTHYRRTWKTLDIRLIASKEEISTVEDIWFGIR